MAFDVFLFPVFGSFGRHSSGVTWILLEGTSPTYYPLRVT